MWNCQVQLSYRDSLLTIHITQLFSNIQKKSVETQIGNVFRPMYLNQFEAVWQVATVLCLEIFAIGSFLNSVLQYSLLKQIMLMFSTKGYKILYNIYWVGFICNNGKLQRIACFAKKRFCAEIFLIFSSFSKKYLSLSFSFVVYKLNYVPISKD